LTLVDEGIIIINDNIAIIETQEGSIQTVSGTYLITFENEIRVNGSLFKNHNGMLKKSPNSATAAILNITSHQEILSLPYLRRLSVENLRCIEEISKGITTRPAISSLSTIIILVSCYAFFKLYRNKINNRKQLDLEAVIKSLGKPGDGLHLAREELTQATVELPK